MKQTEYYELRMLRRYSVRSLFMLFYHGCRYLCRPAAARDVTSPPTTLHDFVHCRFNYTAHQPWYNRRCCAGVDCGVGFCLFSVEDNYLKSWFSLTTRRPLPPLPPPAAASARHNYHVFVLQITTTYGIVFVNSPQHTRSSYKSNYFILEL